MRKIISVGTNLRQGGYEIIRDLMSILTDRLDEVYDSQCHACESILTTSEDILLLFGKRAHLRCKKKSCYTLLELPDVDRLNPAFNGLEEIELAKEQLYKLKKVLDTGSLIEIEDNIEIKTDTLTEEQLPDFSANDVLAIEITMREKGEIEWIGKTKDGKSIKLTIHPSTENYDINMTFAELYALKLAMEALQVKELDIVYSSKSSNVSNRKDSY